MLDVLLLTQLHLRLEKIRAKGYCSCMHFLDAIQFHLLMVSERKQHGMFGHFSTINNVLSHFSKIPTEIFEDDMEVLERYVSPSTYIATHLQLFK